MVPEKVVRAVRYGQLSLGVFLCVCIVLLPHFLFERDEGGVSNYGVYAKTILPYTLAFSLCSFFTGKAAYDIVPTTEMAHSLRRRLWMLTVCLLLVLLSSYPYQVNRTLTYVHVVISLVLFIVELVIGIWLRKRLSKDRESVWFFRLQGLGFLLVFGSAIGLVRVLLVGQLIAGLGFGLLITRVLAHGQVV